MTSAILLLWMAIGVAGGVPTDDGPSREMRSGSLQIMWYNVENLFHPGDDSIARDDEFTPHGARGWSIARYRRKLTSLAKVIVAAGTPEPPGVVGMCEVENRLVLEELVSHPVLAPYRYEVIHSDSRDVRGTDVACIYRKACVGCAGWSAIDPAATGSTGPTRQLLLVELTWGRDTLDLLLLHFISKFSGEGATAGPRRRQAQQLTRLVDSLNRCHPGRLKVVAGDFNDPYHSYALEPLRNACIEGDSLIPAPLAGKQESYKYRGKWSSIDRFLLSGPLEGYRVSSVVFDLPVLLVPDETYGGIKPFRTYQGPLYVGGISDHLPVLLEISRPFSVMDALR
jgi:predicted extracellular nuclease